MKPELVSPTETGALTGALAKARSGLRRDVLELMQGLDRAELLVPLSRAVPGAPEGERIEIDGTLKLFPHLLPDSEGQLFVALFTEEAPLGPVASGLGWTTDDGPLSVCRLPARLAFEMAHAALDEKQVLGLVVDPGAPSELCLSRSELGSLLAGHALPLLAYVRQIPATEAERTLLADPGDPPPPELMQALERCLTGLSGVSGHRLERTFNPDRDLEPHLSLTLQVSESVDQTEVFETVTQALEGKLPDPGYLDVFFET